MTAPLSSMPRRVTVAGLALALAAVVLPGCSQSKAPPTAQPPCAGHTSGPAGGQVPTGLGPGDLVESTEMTPASGSDPTFPAHSRAWRILYVSTGADESDLRLVCAMVALPASGPASSGGTGHMLAWAHGTMGLAQQCLPSSDPSQHLWGPMPSGINAVGWTDLLLSRDGHPTQGALAYAMAHGWAVSMTDYQPDDTYIMGRIAGANVLDAARAATQLASQTFPSAPQSYDMLTWGHSQGGHAALWAGQLAESYLHGTRPSKAAADLSLAGVVALAPASTFVVRTGQPGVKPGDGLADREMHQTVDLLPVPLPVSALQLQIGPALMSLIFGSWSAFSKTPVADGARFPAYPPEAGDLDLSALATREGISTIGQVIGECLGGSGATQVQKAVAPYGDAAQHAMLQPALWNLPKDYREGQYFTGGVDRSCEEVGTAAGTAAGLTPGVQQWCQWIRWNLPGPLGVNPFPKEPSWEGHPVPVLIGQGADDDIIHCQAPASDGPKVPEADQCESRALFDAMATHAYCPDGRSEGHLALDVVREVPFVSPATHLSLPGELSARRISRDKADLSFEGSPIQQFMTGAFERTLEPGCTSRVVNP